MEVLSQKLWLNSPPESVLHGPLPSCAMPVTLAADLSGSEMKHQESGSPVPHMGGPGPASLCPLKEWDPLGKG